ncbi:hypothetical protein BC938DRAFT_473660 [Jimgerdemannia flammicorona]|uniref:Uncharacterized protein n=1 Tax=Jimgerdemannia flammicorona TaxID=994334 RepID=A0A433Q3K2_9FUNG|nr:hypothetical protein BC938DRAFT_473660 [Jimgerdemannia flammicorona]
MDAISVVKYTPALMTDIPVFDTSTATWAILNATGDIPAPRRSHTAVLVVHITIAESVSSLPKIHQIGFIQQAQIVLPLSYAAVSWLTG